MIIKFESYSDYVTATRLLASCVHQKTLFDDLVSLLFDANNLLDEKAILVRDIYLTEDEVQEITKNIEVLDEKLNYCPENNKLELLVNSFASIAFVVAHLQHEKD